MRDKIMGRIPCLVAILYFIMAAINCPAVTDPQTKYAVVKWGTDTILHGKKVYLIDDEWHTLSDSMDTFGTTTYRVSKYRINAIEWFDTRQAAIDYLANVNITEYHQVLEIKRFYDIEIVPIEYPKQQVRLR